MASTLHLAGVVGRRKRTRPGAAVALCLAVGVALRADPDVARVDVVVTAERGPVARDESPAAVTVLTREEIERHPALNLAELLDLVVGFRIAFASSSGGAPILGPRGFFGGGEAEYVKLLVDGVPVADAESGIVDWRQIRAADVERIEVVRGAGSALHGDAALGGVVAVFTRHATLEEPGGGASISTGSFGSHAVDAQGRIHAGALALGAAAGWEQTEGFRDHASAHGSTASASVAWPLATSRLALHLSRVERDREEPGTLTEAAMARDREASDPAFRYDRDEGTRTRAALVSDLSRWGADVSVSLHGALRESATIRTLYLAPGYADTAAKLVDGDGVGLSVDAHRSGSWLGRDVDLMAGVEAGREEVDVAYRGVADAGRLGEELSSVASERRRLAAYVSEGWDVHARLRLVGGTRWDRIDDVGVPSRGAWSPRIGAVLALGDPAEPPVLLHLQLSRAFKAATLDQLFDPRPFPDGTGGTFSISSPDLRPQRARTLEAGVRAEVAPLQAELVIYESHLDDEIDFDPATFRYANIRRSRHRGLETTWRAWRGQALSPFVDYAATLVESREPGGAGRQLKNIPQHTLRTGLDANAGSHVRLQGSATWMAGRYLDDANEVSLDDVLLVELRATIAGRRWELHLDGLNLTDRTYAEMGYVLAGVDGTSESQLLPGAGRTLRLTLALR